MQEVLKMSEMKLSTANRIDLQGFLTELGELSKRYGIVIVGYWGSPYLSYEEGDKVVYASDLKFVNRAYEVAIENFQVIVRGGVIK